VSRFTPQQFLRYVQGLGRRIAVATDRGTHKGALECIPVIQEETRRAGAVFTQEFMKGWSVRRDLRGVVIYNACPHASYVEYGRRPGKMPPVEAIQVWVAVKLKIGGKENRRVAFAIAHKIAANGIKGRNILRRVRWRVRLIVKRAILREVLAEFKKGS
jgi:hypothetical protein